MRERRRSGRGQALVVGLVLAVVAAIAVIATVQIAGGVHERVRVQDTADAAAYSTAAMEARAFNLYSFANRTQASHYVSAMLAQSLLSFLFFTEAFLTDFYGVMRTLDPCSSQPSGVWRAVCPALEAVPYVGPALRFLDGAFTLFETLVSTYQRVLRASGVDERLGRDAIPLLRQASSALAYVSSAVAQGALDPIQDGARQILAANDPRLGAARPTGSLLSACMFDRAHDRAGNGSPLVPNRRPALALDPRAHREDDRLARAKRTMAQIANATRFGCDGSSRFCSERFATGRTLEVLFLPQWLSPVRRLLAQLPKWGQTRLLTFELGRGTDHPEGGNFIREPADAPDRGMAMLAQGDVLGADDVYALRLGPARIGPFENPLSCSADADPLRCWGDNRYGARRDRPFRFMLKTSIWAGSEDDELLAGGGLHWRVAYPGGPRVRGWQPPNAPGGLGALGLNAFERRIAPGVSVRIYVANVRPLRDGNHPWPGVAPFMHFEPGQYAEACAAGWRGPGPSTENAAARLREFNQPSAWVLLDLSPAQVPGLAPAAWLGGSPELRLGEGRLELAPRRGFFGAPGLHVIARAQAYYHRPGNWAEPPNFFNPFWRARLASTWQGRDAFPPVRELAAALPEPLRRNPQRALTH